MPFSNILKHPFLQIIIILFISIIFVFIFSFFVPFNMDEFIQYHSLSCLYYPNNSLNTFREGCLIYDLTLFKENFLPLRSYKYTGSLPGLIYFPLFKLWPSPLSTRFLGVILLIFQSVILHKIFRVNLIGTFLALLLFMPYAFGHLVDTGPIIYHTTAVFLFFYLTKMWIQSLQHRNQWSFVYPSVMSGVLFLAVWVKLAFFFVLPAAFILVIFCVFSELKNNLKIKTVLWQTILATSISLTTILILLNATDRFGNKYYRIITDSPTTDSFSLQQWGRHIIDNIAPYLLNPLRATHYVFEKTSDSFIFGIAAFLLLLSLLILGIYFLYRRKESSAFVMLNIFLFLLTLFMLSLSKKTWAMHHVVLAFPFLILAVFDIYSKLRMQKIIIGLIGCVFLFNLYFYYQITQLKYLDKNHPALFKLNHQLNKQFNEKKLFVVVDWGMYYLKALYGNKDQAVIYMQPFTQPWQVLEIKRLLNDTKRKAVFIGRVDGEDSLKYLPIISKYFPNAEEMRFSFDAGPWRVWYEN